ncbi:TadE/TadG family type IV pilus assembly protein [Fulvimarina sp. MAC8]|uniref:TadE/TadG family type IV pilus assembly protein n=1 Tax=Fulvimarina sp. MAC8 TaxID=3162874 RepID=UPI0032EC85A5
MRLRCFGSDEKGATAIEFALILFPMLLLFLGTFEFARALQTNNNLSYAAGLASRAILTDNAITEDALSAKIRNAFVGGDPDRLTIAYASEVSGGVTFREMTLSYPFDFVISAVSSKPITLSVTRRVPTE